jgi:hypothetical protein
VVAIGEALAVLEIQLGQRDVAVVLDRELVAFQRIAEAEVVEIERMGLVVEPVEADLDRVVQARQPHRFAH